MLSMSNIVCLFKRTNIEVFNVNKVFFSSKFDSFFDVKTKANEQITTGRSWTASDLRRKVSHLLIHKISDYILSIRLLVLL